MPNTATNFDDRNYAYANAITIIALSASKTANGNATLIRRPTMA